jgi:hypothetical protein
VRVAKDGRRIDCATSCIRIVLHFAEGHECESSGQCAENGALQQGCVMLMGDLLNIRLWK